MGRMNGVGGGGAKRGEYKERGGVGSDFPEGERGDGELNRRIYGIENEFLNNLLVGDVVSDCDAWNLPVPSVASPIPSSLTRKTSVLDHNRS